MSPLTPAEYQAILKQDLMSFIVRSFYELNSEKKLLISPHMEVIATALEKCRRGEITRLIINLPPRSLKSHSVSIAFVAWLLGHKPSLEIICASYGQDLALKLARDCRTLMTSAFYHRLFPQTQLSADKYSVEEFTTTMQGLRMATSIDGVLTGRGGDFIIIDDPLKPDEAMSETRRTKVNEWYDNTLQSRLNNKTTGCIILVMQRLHQDDLVAHVMQQEGWHIVSFPAIAENDESHPIESPLGRRIYHRSEGGILHPEHEPQVILNRLRDQLGDFTFSAQYQQNPKPRGGAMVKTDWLLFYTHDELPKRFDLILQSWDTANKSGELNDYSVCTTWGKVNKKIYLLHVFRKRLNYPDLKRNVIDLAKIYNPRKILIEDKASGTQLIDELRGKIFGVVGYKIPANTDKIMRMHAQTSMFESGHVFLPQNAPWLADYINELTSFPGTKYDDQVDSTAQALEHLRPLSHLEIWAILGRG